MTHVFFPFAPVKYNDATKDLRFSPITSHIGNSSRILLRIPIYSVRKGDWWRIVESARLDTAFFLIQHLFLPVLVELVFVCALIKLEEVGTDLVTRYDDKLYQTKMEFF